MNTAAKGDRLALHVKREAEAMGLPVVKVRSSGHMGRRGGVAADVVVAEWRVECKRYARGIGAKAVEDILLGPQGVDAVAHQRDRGIALVTLELKDWLDLLQQSRRLIRPETLRHLEREAAKGEADE